MRNFFRHFLLTHTLQKQVRRFCPDAWVLPNSANTRFFVWDGPRQTEGSLIIGVGDTERQAWFDAHKKTQYLRDLFPQ